MTFGVDSTFFFWEGFACKRLCQIYTYAVALYFLSTISLFGFVFTGAGMDIIFKDLEAETIHVCIAWALLNILGCFLLLCYSLLFSSFTDCFSVHGIWGLVNNASLPLVCGRLGLVAKPLDAELFLFEIDILGGLSRCASLDRYALKMLSLLPFFHLFH